METFNLKNTYPTINPEAQRYLDASFVKATGLPTLILMEQAASAISQSIVNILPEADNKILFLAGKGNNAGDAYASARQLMAQSYQVDLLDLFPDSELKGDALQNQLAYKSLAGKVLTNSDLSKIDLSPYALIVDGIMGTGFNLTRPLSKSLVDFLSRINSEKNPIKLAIDIPTGIDSRTGQCDKQVFEADYTVTFSAYKTAMWADPGTAYCGKIILANISMPSAWLEEKLGEYQQEKDYLPRVLTRKTFESLEIVKDVLSHKGKSGKGLIVGGSDGMAGAIHLAIRGAEATGIGYLYSRVSEEILPVILDNFPQTLTTGYPKKEEWSELLEKVDAFAIGPGAGSVKWLNESLDQFIFQTKRGIIDADALNYLAKVKDWDKITKQRYSQGLEPLVLTPHPGEFQRLAPELISLLKEDRQGAASQLAQRSGCIVVLKGHRTVIAFPNGQVYLNSSGNQGLAKAGSGDVLTGLMLGFACQMKELHEAVCLAVYFHGLLGDIAKEDLGIRRMQPSDLFSYVKKAFLLLNWHD